MATSLNQGGFERLAAWQARAVLIVTATLTLGFVAVTLSPLASGFADGPDRGPTDVALYRAEVDRVHAGASYYDAAAAELTARGYPTRSLFNWRTPLPVWLLGVLPDLMIGRALLGLLAAAVMLLSCHLLARDGTLGRAIFCGLLMIGALMPCVLGDLFVMHELWAGALIALSVLAYGAGRPGWGIAAGFAALLMRELAAPYCGLCLLLAISDRRRREVTVWLALAAIYAIWYGAHAIEVLPRIAPDAIAHASGWICLGGAAFVISIVQMNAYLLLLPQWVSGVYLSLALLGFAGWQAPWGRRAGLTAALYLGGMAIVGQPFNQYWGSLVAPLLCLGVAQAPAALVVLWRAARLTELESKPAAITSRPGSGCSHPCWKEPESGPLV